MEHTAVAIIDPLTPARLGLKSLLENHDYGFSVVKVYGDIRSFQKYTNKQFDIILINPYAIGYSDSFDIRELLPDNPHSMIVAMSNEFLVPPALNSFDGMLNIYMGEQEIADELAKLHQRFLLKENATSPHKLTRREKMVLLDIFNGLGNQEIADKLCVSIHTVRSHRRNLRAKTRIETVAQFVDYVRNHNLIEF